MKTTTCQMCAIVADSRENGVRSQIARDRFYNAFCLCAFFSAVDHGCMQVLSAVYRYAD